MNCAGCDQLLERWEVAQPMRIGQNVFRPRSFCTACTRAGSWEPGSDASLRRLGTAETDADEVARVAEATKDWLPLFADMGRDGNAQVPLAPLAEPPASGFAGAREEASA